MHNLLAEQQTSPPLFPISESVVGHGMGLYGQFEPAELHEIVRGNIDVGRPDGPMAHLLAFREQPIPAFLSTVEPSRGEVVGYQVGVCLIGTIISRWAREHPPLHAELDGLTVDPGRMYLPYGDMPIKAAQYRMTYWPRLAHDFALSEHYLPYFTTTESHERLLTLKEQISQHGGSFLEGTEKTQERHFGYFCRGLVDTLQLYDRALFEARTAPAGDIEFDPDRHEVIAENPLVVPKRGYGKRWRTGGIAYPSDAGEAPVAYRGVAGVVLRNRKRTAVLFTASKEEIPLAEDDLVLAHGHQKADLSDYDWRTYPFDIKGEDAEAAVKSSIKHLDNYQPLGFLRGDTFHFLHEPYLGPEPTFKGRFFDKRKQEFGLALTWGLMEQDYQADAKAEG